MLFICAFSYAQEGYKIGLMEVGGFVQAGAYPNDHGNKSVEANSPLVAPMFNLDQAYLWAKKDAATDKEGFDWGFGADIFFGADQWYYASTGADYYDLNNNTEKYYGDSKWFRHDDHSMGVYGFSIPQAYLEGSYNGWKLKVGHYLSPVGYESILAPESDFYTLSYFSLSLPTVLTGVQLDKKLGDVDLFLGLSNGLQTGPENPFNDYFFTFGFSAPLYEDVSLNYGFIGGRYKSEDDKYRGIREDAGGDIFHYVHNLYLVYTPVEKLRLTTEAHYAYDMYNSNYRDDTGLPMGLSGVENSAYGLTQYGVYSFNDKFSVAGRAEWEQTGANVNYIGTENIYSLTANLTYKPCKYFFVRPEVRYSWATYEAFNDGESKKQFNAGIEFTAMF